VTFCVLILLLLFVNKCNSTETGPDETTGEARMYARPGDPMCPVQSFRKYLSKLHPDLECLWQRPLDSFAPSYGVWYSKVPLGKNTLGDMMAEISDVAGLSQRYTNHCIRATFISTLDRAGIEARHIMRDSGHKSEAFIRSYSRRLTESTLVMDLEVSRLSLHSMTRIFCQCFKMTMCLWK